MPQLSFWLKKYLLKDRFYLNEKVFGWYCIIIIYKNY